MEWSFIQMVIWILDYLSGIYHFWPLFLFQNFFEHIFKHINAPLSGLFWKTEKCRSEESEEVLLASTLEFVSFSASFSHFFGTLFSWRSNHNMLFSSLRCWFIWHFASWISSSMLRASSVWWSGSCAFSTLPSGQLPVPNRPSWQDLTNFWSRITEKRTEMRSRKKFGTKKMKRYFYHQCCQFGYFL